MEKICSSPEASLLEVMERINRNQKGIVLIVDSSARLLETITDGDIRRAVMGGYSLLTPVREILKNKKSTGAMAGPVATQVGSDKVHLRELMKKKCVRQIPLVDEEGRVRDLVTWADLVPDDEAPPCAVIMAGGFGTRLAPLTGETPKPLLKVGDKPIMEMILGQLASSGVSKVNVTTHYLDEKIRAHFGDGSDLGLDLSYVKEDQPLGTAGALGLMETPEDTLLIINGDILTNVDFKAMMAFHREQEAALTVGVRKYDLQVPYGVVETDGSLVTSLTEKPNMDFFVNAGIYLLEPQAHGFIDRGQAMDMTDLINRLLEAGEPVASFPIVEYWLDIGSHEDYQRAQEDMRNGALKK